MRTTVEIPDRQRAKLMEMAAERGEKGFSRLVQEAISAYLKTQAERKDRVRAALSVMGTFTESEAEAMRASIKKLRSRWR